MAHRFLKFEFDPGKALCNFNDKDIFFMRVQGIIHVLIRSPAIMITIDGAEGCIRNFHEVAVTVNIEINIPASRIINGLVKDEFILVLKPLYVIQVAYRYQVFAGKLMNAKTIIQGRSPSDNFFHEMVRVGYQQQRQSNKNKKNGDYFSHIIKIGNR